MERLVITNPNIQVVFARAIGDLVEYIATHTDKVVGVMLPDGDSTRISQILSTCGATLDSFTVDSDNGVPYRITFNKTRSKLAIGMLRNDYNALQGYTVDALLCYNVNDDWDDFYKAFLPVCESRSSIVGIYMMAFNMCHSLECMVNSGRYTQVIGWKGLLCNEKT